MESKTLWQEHDEKLSAIEIIIPDESLENIEYILIGNDELPESIKSEKVPINKSEKVLIKSEKDLEKIPVVGGCYWILTNEQIKHYFHRKRLPKKDTNDFEIIYNGVTKSGLQNRIREHLLSGLDSGRSGIGIDIWIDHHTEKEQEDSWNRKKAMAKIGKVPFVRINDKFEAIRSKENLLKMNLSEAERKFIENYEGKKIRFRNGINIEDEKHKNSIFFVYFISGISDIYAEIIEHKWRRIGTEEVILPRLCSYLSGR
jgi:hypothetical protein